MAKAKRTRQKIPIGAGSYFVVTGTTSRFPIINPAGRVVAELLVNTQGNGAICLTPPGCIVPDGATARPLVPLDAAELLRRCNMTRLSRGEPELPIPAALLRRARAETLPGLEALVPFPGQFRQFFEGRESWAGTGLWVSVRGECQLELPSSVGFLRKQLTRREAELWLEANGHPTDCLEALPPKDGTRGAWEVATAGSVAGWSLGSHQDARLAADVVPPPKKPTSKREQELRAAIRRTRSIPPPAISPPRKRRPTRRGR